MRWRKHLAWPFVILSLGCFVACIMNIVNAFIINEGTAKSMAFFQIDFETNATDSRIRWQVPEFKAYNRTTFFFQIYGFAWTGYTYNDEKSAFRSLRAMEMHCKTTFSEHCALPPFLTSRCIPHLSRTMLLLPARVNDFHPCTFDERAD